MSLDLSSPTLHSTAIAIRGLGKCYHMYGRPMDRLKQSFWRGRKQFYRLFWALRGVSFEVRRGEVMGIIGRNGSGKSTLLQLIAGTLAPSEGEVEVHGRVAALLELGSGFNPDFTGRENVYMNGTILGLSREEIDRRFDAIAGFADIGDFLDQPVKTYSSGMVVRLAFAVQVQIEPEILIVDEALSVGDEAFQRKCFSRIGHLRDKGATILFVSHSGSTIVELCDRAMLLEGGVRVLTGSPNTIVRQYQRLLYSPPAERDRILDDINRIDRQGGVDHASDAHAQEGAGVEAEVAEEPDEDEGQFDPGFVSKSTVNHPEVGARIVDLHMRDRRGRRVNLVLPGHSYEVRFRVEFQADAVGVTLGTHFRNVSGVTLAGQRHPATGSTLDLIRAGDTIEVRFRFRMLLLVGTYFVTAGAWADTGNVCLHRIVDAYMFRVMAPALDTCFGYVDLSDAGPTVVTHLTRGASSAARQEPVT